ncbi:hypothetical protein JTB14_024135 [Gonioctena quinquepunctata]|nr:hypothetical protein JTB14_024135 [Gonioctena quinquepunctata]
MSADVDDVNALTPGHLLRDTYYDSCSRFDLATVFHVLSSYKGLVSISGNVGRESTSKLCNNGVDNVPPCNWTMRRIVDLNVGRDNITRIATVKTANVKHSHVKLCQLPTD